MEILVELAFALLQFIAELLIQIVLELLTELGMHSVKEPFRPAPVNPFLAAIGYALFGMAAGWLSLLVFPESFIDAEWLRVVNVIVAPIAAGAMMGLLGAWRRRRNEDVLRIDRFGYGYLFALAMGLVRFFGVEG